MSKLHHYSTTITWTGNQGTGTSDYRAYKRDHTISVSGKEPIFASSDPAFRGDKTKYNPEDLLLASIASCHMLWYLHLCADAGIIVVGYVDQAKGTMTETEGGGGHFVEITLEPTVTITEASMAEKAKELHGMANKKCFISNSVNFPIHHKPIIKVL